MLPTICALSYVLSGHALGVACLVAAASGPSAAALRLAGVLLVSHTLLLSTFLVHDATHGTLFASEAANAAAGEAGLWLCGAGYASFARVRHMHMRHHRDRQDTGVVFDHVRFLKALPAPLLAFVHALEWAYVPAVELIMAAQARHGWAKRRE